MGMKTVRSHKSEATEISDKTEKTPEKSHLKISELEISEEEAVDNSTLEVPETERPEKRSRESVTSRSSDEEEKAQAPRELEDNKREEGECFGDMVARQEEADRTPKAEMETR